MANISQFLKKIKEAIYGEEVRGSIHDAIDAINNDAVSAVDDASSALDAANIAVFKANGISNRVGALSSLTTEIKTSIVAAINWINLNKIGDLKNLKTDNKSNVVAAINWINSNKIDSYAVIDSVISMPESMYVDDNNGNWLVKYVIPSITIHDDTYGTFSLPAVTDEWYGTFESDKACYIKYTFDPGSISVSGYECILLNNSKNPNSYVEISIDNSLISVNIYIGSVYISKSYAHDNIIFYNGIAEVNENTNVPLSHYWKYPELSDSVSDSSSNKAATPSAVKQSYDKAVAAMNKFESLPSIVSANKWAYFPTLTELPSAVTNEWTNDGAGYNIVFSFSNDTLLLYKGRFFELSASAATDYSQNSSNAKEIWGNLAGAILIYTLNLSNNTFTPSFVKTDCLLEEVRDTFEPNKYSVNGTQYIKLPAMYCTKDDYDATDTGNTPFKYTYLTDLYIKGGVITVAKEPKNDYYRYSIHDINKADIVLNCAWGRYPSNVDEGNDAKNNTAALMSLLKCMGSPTSANLMFLHGCFYLGRMSLDQYTLQANSIRGLGGYETTIDIGDSKFGISATNIDDIQMYTHCFNAGISVKATNLRRVGITAMTTSENYTLLYLNSGGHMSECYIDDTHNCGEDLPTGLFNVHAGAITTISNSNFSGVRTKIGSFCRVYGNRGNNSSVTIDTNSAKCIVTGNVGLTVTNLSTSSVVNNNIE